MKRAKADPCVLSKRKSGRLMGMVILKVDESRTEEFLAQKETDELNFKKKRRKLLGKSAKTFNGIILRRQKDGCIEMDQVDKVEKRRYHRPRRNSRAKEN